MLSFWGRKSQLNWSSQSVAPDPDLDTLLENNATISVKAVLRLKIVYHKDQIGCEENLAHMSSNGWTFITNFNHLTQVAGPYVPQFEIYWKKLDPENTGKVFLVFVCKNLNQYKYGILKVAPMVAAQFLKLSGLSDQTLGKVGKWKCEGVWVFWGVAWSTILSLLLEQQSDTGDCSFDSVSISGVSKKKV